MSTEMTKKDAHRIVDMLPDGASWEDLMREIYVREAIERGLTDSREGRLRDVGAVRGMFGLAK